MADKHGVAIKGRGLLTGFQHELSRWRNSSGQTLLLASVIQGGGQGSVSSKVFCPRSDQPSSSRDTSSNREEPSPLFTQ